jgi:phage terminase small subunit
MLTGKQERFSQEVAKGSTQADAFRTAYNVEKMKDKSIHEKASKLMANVKVRARVEEIKATIEKETIQEIVYDRVKSFKKLEMIQNLALTPNGENGKLELNTATKTEELMGKLWNLYTEKVDVTGSVDHTINVIIKA